MVLKNMYSFSPSSGDYYVVRSTVGSLILKVYNLPHYCSCGKKMVLGTQNSLVSLEFYRTIFYMIVMFEEKVEGK